MLTLITVPMYQLTILLTYYETCKLEELAALVNCIGMSFKTRRSWMYVEVLGFFVNMAVLMAFALWNLSRTKLAPVLFSCLDTCCKKKNTVANWQHEDEKEEEQLPNFDQKFLNYVVK